MPRPHSHDAASCRNARSAGGGIYLHVAYCRKKCIYCDFFSAGQRIADWHRYVDALIAELKHRIDEMPCPLRTIYIGGGTPSLIPADEFLRLAEALSPYMSEIEEFTLEANPDDITEEMLEVWKRGGADRLSIGIQCFQDDILSAIGRRHDSSTAEQAYRLARRYFDNISIDLMFGLPNQTMDMWSEDVEKAICMNPEHISAYSLMYENGTALTALRDQGKLQETPEEVSEGMFSFLTDSLRKAGYDHYEISNYAKPGYRSRHNSSYWIQKPYLGLGPSAHTYDGNRRRKANSTDLKGYLRRYAPLEEENFASDYGIVEENLSDEELREEYVMTRLRTREGIPLDDFRRRFGEKESAVLLDKAMPLIADRRLLHSEGKLALSESAILTSDAVIIELI